MLIRINCSERTKLIGRSLYGVTLLLITIITLSVVFILQSTENTFTEAIEPIDVSLTHKSAAPFPLGVNPKTETIIEDPDFETYLITHNVREYSHPQPISLVDRIVFKLSLHDWYQNLASPISRILVILPGERKEEVTKNLGDILKWTEAERLTFNTIMSESEPVITDGKIFPAKYVVSKDASPEEVARMLIDRFETEILARYSPDIAASVPLADALIIASLLEREAYDFEDMRYISGIIWNRLFVDMKLQLDATLQYAKATNPTEPKWWPPVVPKDKYIDSPFNTYKHAGLPPAPIANPSLASIIAALNPRQTDCIFYFHDRRSGFHCSVTYEDHVAKLKQYYGQGR